MIEKHIFSKNSALRFDKHGLSTDKLCFWSEKHTFSAINRVYQCLMYNVSKSYVFRSINIVFRDKLCFSSEKLCFPIEKHCLSPINSVFRFITHLAWHRSLPCSLCVSHTYDWRSALPCTVLETSTADVIGWWVFRLRDV